jgi:hypothetical protein
MSTYPGLRRFARIALCLVAAALCAAMARGAHAAEDWRAIVSPYDQVFPALALTSQTLASRGADANVLGDASGLIGAVVLAGRDQQRARLSVQLPGYAATSTLDVTLPRAGQRYTLYPRMRWNEARLRRTHAPEQAKLTLQLRLDDGPVRTATRNVRVRGADDVPYFVRARNGDAPLGLYWMFAAFVDEDHPLSRRVLNQARKNGIVDGFDGYAERDPERVYRQAFALWHELQQRGIRYSPITRSVAIKDRVLSQRVRRLEESWENAQANCVDGSVLFASLLRRAGLNASLVLVPGHMFVAFDLDARGRERAYLDTMLLGTQPGARSEAASLATFQAAVARGLAQYQQARTKFDDEREPEYQVIDIDAARRLGVKALRGP